jgi:hypothetical protein
MRDRVVSLRAGGAAKNKLNYGKKICAGGKTSCALLIENIKASALIGRGYFKELRILVVVDRP